MEEKDLLEAIKKVAEENGTAAFVDLANKALENQNNDVLIIKTRNTKTSSPNDTSSGVSNNSNLSTSIIKANFEYSQRVLNTSLFWNKVWRVTSLVLLATLIGIFIFAAYSVINQHVAFTPTLYIVLTAIAAATGGLGTHTLSIDRANSKNRSNHEIKELLKQVIESID